MAFIIGLLLFIVLAGTRRFRPALAAVRGGTMIAGHFGFAAAVKHQGTAGAAMGADARDRVARCRLHPALCDRGRVDRAGARCDGQLWRRHHPCELHPLAGRRPRTLGALRRGGRLALGKARRLGHGRGRLLALGPRPSRPPVGLADPAGRHRRVAAARLRPLAPADGFAPRRACAGPRGRRGSIGARRGRPSRRPAAGASAGPISPAAPC